MPHRGKTTRSDVDLPSFGLLPGQAYVAWLETTGRLQSEAVEFLNDRFEKVATTARDLGHCKNPAEYFELQTRYAEGALADWLGESRKMIELVGEIAQEAAAPHADRSVEQVAGRRSSRARHGKAAH